MAGKVLSPELEKYARRRVDATLAKVSAQVVEEFRRERRLEVAALRAQFDQAVAALREREARLFR